MTGEPYYRARYYDPQIGRFISEDPLRFASGDQDFYLYGGNNSPTLVDPTGLTWRSNWNYFRDWVSGRGNKKRHYGPEDLETGELMQSIGANKVRDAFYKNHCNDVKGVGYGTVEAYWDTVINPKTADWSNTSAEVGGFAGASAIKNGNGTVTFTIPNTSGRHSFFLHAVPDRKSPTGLMSNIYQEFTRTEPIEDCKCQQ